jgi:DNA-directed RNA polymerase specialized sigma24 family protein
MQNPQPIRKQRSNEELFFDYSAQLLEWAIQLTQLNRADAEDLVQDFYIQISQIGFPLDGVEELRPYLFKILRNLHYSRLRQKSKIPISDLSALDYDSVERSLGAVDWRGLFLVRANLKQLCEFACQRRRTARAASIFLLRFFLGYYPSEVMKVVQTTRVGIDKALQYMRREALRNLDKAASAQAASPQQPNISSSTQVTDHSGALFLELQEKIFSSCEGPCFDPDALKQHYEEQPAKQFTVAELAHLVSCATCLDRVNGILGLPRIDDRSPDDTIGRNNPPSGGSAEGPRLSLRRPEQESDSDSRKKLERRRLDWFEHRPASLEIAVNGEIRTSQKITAEVSELHLKLNRAETSDFVEVFSEQGVRLLYLHVLEPSLCPGLQQRQMVDLSDDRSLCVTLSFAGDLPTVHVVYRDPVFAQLAEAADQNDLPVSRAEKTNNADSDDASDSSQPGSILKFPARDGLFSSLYAKPSRTWFPRMSPLLATGLALAFASIICIVLWTRSGPGVSAHDLLLHAQKQEATVALNHPTGVIVQRVRIKTPVRTTERTLYRDIQRQRHARNRALDGSDAKLKAKLAGAGVDWDDPLSPVAYRDWRNRELLQNDSVQSVGDNLLTLTTKVNDGEVISESLTVRASDFHPVGKTVRLRDYGTVEIAEVNYSVLPWDAVNPNWFEPAGITNPGASSDMPPALLPRLPVSLTDGELDEAELSARLALNQLHADTGEQIQIVRDPSGIVVKGIVETEQRRHQLDDQLDMLSHVTASISSIEELKARPAQAGELSSVKVIEMQTQATPLETYYLAQGRGVAPVGDLAQQLFNTAFAINLESRATDDLQHRFAYDEGISTVASATVADLLFTHKHKLLAALEDEERLLADAQIKARRSKEAASTNGTDLTLAALAERNLALTKELALSKGESGRSAETIASQLAASMNELSFRAHAVQVMPQNSTNLGKRK